MRNPAIIDPTTYSHQSNGELRIEAARKLCNQGMGLLANEVAVMRRGSAENHRLVVILAGCAVMAAALIGAWVK